MLENEMLPKTKPVRKVGARSNDTSSQLRARANATSGINVPELKGAELSEVGRRVSWRRNTATVTADSIDAFQGGIPENALDHSQSTNKPRFRPLDLAKILFPKQPCILSWECCLKANTLILPFASKEIFFHLSNRNFCQARSRSHRKSLWKFPKSIFPSYNAHTWMLWIRTHLCFVYQRPSRLDFSLMSSSLYQRIIFSQITLPFGFGLLF